MRAIRIPNVSRRALLKGQAHCFAGRTFRPCHGGCRRRLSQSAAAHDRAAKKEGQVIYYTSTICRVAENWQKLFRANIPG